MNRLTSRATRTPEGNDTIYLSTIDKDGNIVSLIQSNYSRFRLRADVRPAPDSSFIIVAGCSHSKPEPSKHARSAQAAVAHDHSGVHGEGRRRIGFGIMGGFQSATGACTIRSRISRISDSTFRKRWKAGRFTKGTFQGCDVNIEELIPGNIRRELTALGHQINVAQPRSGTFGWGQAVMSDLAGVHYGASEPRHDGAAIPQFPVLFTPAR